jgi:hypothetical protein
VLSIWADPVQKRSAEQSCLVDQFALENDLYPLQGHYPFPQRSDYLHNVLKQDAQIFTRAGIRCSSGTRLLKAAAEVIEDDSEVVEHDLCK